MVLDPLEEPDRGKIADLVRVLPGQVKLSELPIDTTSSPTGATVDARASRNAPSALSMFSGSTRATTSIAASVTGADSSCRCSPATDTALE